MIESYQHQLPTEAQQPVIDDTREFWVTCRDGSRVGWLLGPYDTHEEALENVDVGKRLAIDQQPYAHFYTFGTASTPKDLTKKPTAVFEKL